jgi:hypothetical protein
VKEVSQYAE